MNSSPVALSLTLHLPLCWKVKRGAAWRKIGRCIVRIGEAAIATGMTTKTLRFYEDRGLLPTAHRTSNGYRDYGNEMVARLDFIRRGRIAGLTLAQIGDILRVRDAGAAPCTHVRDLLARQLTDLDRQIAELMTLRATVAEYHDVAAAADPISCDAERICSYL
jgi:MerR family copper efflux transcriptional regulator